MSEHVTATAAAYAIDNETKNLLKIKGNFSFIAISTELLEKHKAKEFDIIDSDNLILVARTKQAEQPTENKIPTKEIV